MAGEMVTVPLDSLPKDYVEKHLKEKTTEAILSDINENLKRLNQNPVMGSPQNFNEDQQPNGKPADPEAISKAEAAIEVVKVLEKMRLVSIIALVALVICVGGAYITPLISIGAFIGGAGFVGYMFATNERYKNYLIGEYLQRRTQIQRNKGF